MTYGVDMIIPICHDDDNDGVDTSSSTGVAYAEAQGMYCGFPTNLSVRDTIVIQAGGFSRDYSAAGEGGFACGVLDHDLGGLNTEASTSTTTWNLTGDVLGKSFEITPHSDLVTHATSAKLQSNVNTRKSIAVSSRMTTFGLLCYVLKRA